MSTTLVSLALVALAAGAPVVGTKPHIVQAREHTLDSSTSLRGLVAQEARAHGVNPRLVAAIVTVESNWNPLAMHFEPTYRHAHNVKKFAAKNKLTPETERNLQRTALGMLQLVGGTARSLGFDGQLITLLDPQTNLHWGCKYIATLKARYPNLRDQAAAFNAGSARRSKSTGLYVNQEYVARVMAAYARQPKGS